MSRLRFVPVTITSGQSLSPAAHVGSEVLVAIILPAIDSAAITFQACETEAGTYRDVYTSAGEYSPAAASTGSRRVLTDVTFTEGIGAWVKVRSGLSGAAVNQTADRTITLVTRNI